MRCVGCSYGVQAALPPKGVFSLRSKALMPSLRGFVSAFSYLRVLCYVRKTGGLPGVPAHPSVRPRAFPEVSPDSVNPVNPSPCSFGSPDA